MALTDHLALAIDPSAPSAVALRATFKLATLCHARQVSLVHAAREIVWPEGEGQETLRAELEDLKQRIDSAAEANIMALVSEAGAQPFQVTLKIVHGKPARVIPSAAKALGATLLVLGTHARKGVRRLVLGSIAETMLRGVELPVLVATAGEDGRDPEAELDSLSRVLVAVDFSEGSDLVVAAGVELARACSARAPSVILTFVTPVTRRILPDVERVPSGGIELDAAIAKAHEMATRRLETLAEAYAPTGIPIEPLVIEGDPEEEIVRAADQRGAGLIVVGTHGRGRALIHDLGSTAASVIRHSNVGVLVVPTAVSS